MTLPNDVEEGDFSMMEGCSVNTNSLVRWEFARAVQMEDKDKVQAFDLTRRRCASDLVTTGIALSKWGLSHLAYHEHSSDATLQ